MVELPEGAVHRMVAKQVFGKEYVKVDRLMDMAFKIIPSPEHRVWGHDMLSILALFAHDSEMLNAAILHLLLDQAASGDREFHKMLRVLKELES